MFDFKHIVTSLIDSNNRIKKENNIKRLEKIINHNFKKKYNTSNPKYICSLNLFYIENLIYNKRSHLVELFKDYMLWGYIDEFLRRFYKYKESSERISTLYLYYKQYLSFFCKPMFTSFTFNDILIRGEEKKAKLYYNNYYANKKKEKEDNIKDNGILNIDESKSINNNNYNDSNYQFIIFNDTMRKKLENNSQYNSSFKLSESSIKLIKEKNKISTIFSDENSLMDIIDEMNSSEKYKTKYRIEEKIYFKNKNNHNNKKVYEYNNKNNISNNVKLIKQKNNQKYINSRTINNTKRDKKIYNDNLTVRLIKKNQNLILPSYTNMYQANLKKGRKGSQIHINNYFDLNSKEKLEKNNTNNLYDISNNLNNIYNNNLNDNNYIELKSRNYKNRKNNSCENKIDFNKNSSLKNIEKKLTVAEFNKKPISLTLQIFKKNIIKNANKELFLNDKKSQIHKEYIDEKKIFEYEEISDKNKYIFKDKLKSNKNTSNSITKASNKKSFIDILLENEIINKKIIQKKITSDIEMKRKRKTSMENKFNINSLNNNFDYNNLYIKNNFTKKYIQGITSRISQFKKNVPKTNNFYNYSNDNTKNSKRYSNYSQGNYFISSSSRTGRIKVGEDESIKLSNFDNKKFNSKNNMILNQKINNNYNNNNNINNNFNYKRIYSYCSQDKQISNNKYINISSRNNKVTSYTNLQRPTSINNSSLRNITHIHEYNACKIKLRKNNSIFSITKKDIKNYKNNFNNKNNKKNYKYLNETYKASNESKIDGIYKKYNISKINFEKYMANKRKENMKNN